MAAGKERTIKPGYRNVGWHPGLGSDYLFEAPSLDGRLPFMEIKAFYVLSDLSESNSGSLWLVPGSHKRTPQELRDMDGRIDPADALELKLPSGAAVLWRTVTWHCVGPNLSNKTRKIMHVDYHYRWLRPTDYIQQNPELVAGSSPIRRQLLGALATGSNPLGNDPEFHSSSQYWLTENWDDVPLRAWVKEHPRPPPNLQSRSPHEPSISVSYRLDSYAAGPSCDGITAPITWKMALNQSLSQSSGGELSIRP